MKSTANWPGGSAGSCQVGQGLAVLTPPARYWKRYRQGTPLEVIHATSRLLRPKWRRSLGRAGAAASTGSEGTVGTERAAHRHAPSAMASALRFRKCKSVGTTGLWPALLLGSAIS